MNDTDKKKPDCYKCEYRGTIAGNTHSCCNHPSVKQDSNMFGALVEMLQGKNTEAAKELNIQGHEQGIRCDWFMWPANFDPVWLTSCGGFQVKAKNPCKP